MNTNGLPYISKCYSVNAKIGTIVKFTDGAGIVRDCTIIGSRNAHLRVRSGNHNFIIHPTWNVEWPAE